MSFDKEERCIDPAKPRCQMAILAIGQIDQQTPEQFKAYAQGFPTGTWVVLSSPGGSLISGLRFGQLIREMGFNTTVGSTDYSPPNCYSSCAYAFAGGVSRHLAEGSRYGIHQFRGRDQVLNEDQSQKLTVTISTYLDAMGVDRHLQDYAQMTTSDKVSVLTLAQAKLLRVDNTNQSPYPRWRLEAANNGQLVAINNPPRVAGKPLATLALVQTPNSANKTIVFLIYYKSIDENLFKEKIEHHLTINQKSYPLKQLENWIKKTDGYQAAFSPSDGVLDLLAQSPEDSTINLSSAIENIRFGVGGFKNIYQAISGNQNKSAAK